MIENIKFLPDQEELLLSLRRYRRLIGKLNYIIVIVIHLIISFTINMVSQFLISPCKGHWDEIICIIKYIKGGPRRDFIYENKGHTQIV